MACLVCSGTGWVRGVKTVTVAGESYEADFSRRCVCVVTGLRQERDEGMVTPEGMKKLFGDLSLLKFFPADNESRQALAKQIERFATSDEQLDWLGQRAVVVFREWPGLMELRACFNSTFTPKDGISATSEIYPEGFPSEQKGAAKQLPAPRIHLLPGGQKDEAVDDPESQAMVAELKDALPKMPIAEPTNDDFARLLEETITAPTDREPLPGPTPQIIKQADIDRAVAELHAKQKGDDDEKPPTTEG